jgi:hypothetical protein
MVTLRCSQALLRKIRSAIEDDLETESALGNWYGRAIFVRPVQLVLCTNERSLLSVVIPLSPVTTLVDRFRSAAIDRINQIPISSELLAKECSALEDIRVGRAKSRSVISAMNHLTYGVESWLAYPQPNDLEHLGLTLCNTPISSISTHWPWLEAELLMTGSAVPGRKWKVPPDAL